MFLKNGCFLKVTISQRLPFPIRRNSIWQEIVGVQGVGSVSKYAYHVASDENIAYREGGAMLSAPEVSFEKNAIASLETIGKEGKQLGFYMKSPENSNRSYRIGVEAIDKTKVSDFYPDYMGEIYDSKSKTYSPFIVEVKSEAEVKESDGNKSSLLIAKAKALISVSGKHNVKAGIAYEKNMGESGNEWVIITKIDAEGKITTSNFKEYMFS